MDKRPGALLRPRDPDSSQELDHSVPGRRLRYAIVGPDLLDNLVAYTLHRIESAHRVLWY